MNKHRLIGKIVVALAIGLAVGYGVGVSVAADHKRGENLTLEAYTADFERYRAELMEAPVSTEGYLIFGVFFTFAVFGIYEGLGRGLGWAIGRVAGRRDDTPAPPYP